MYERIDQLPDPARGEEERRRHHPLPDGGEVFELDARGHRGGQQQGTLEHGIDFRQAVAAVAVITESAHEAKNGAELDRKNLPLDAAVGGEQGQQLNVDDAFGAGNVEAQFAGGRQRIRGRAVQEGQVLAARRHLVRRRVAGRRPLGPLLEVTNVDLFELRLE